jgi:CDP-diacylglycerol---glycerol-3-phosphate 3-phosphatidyltransferase
VTSWVLFYLSGLLLMFLALRQSAWGAEHSGQWLGLAGLTAVGILLYLRRHLHDNHPPDQPDNLYPTLGLANQMSLGRGFLLACMAGFLLSPWPQGWLGWLPVGLYTTAVLLDLFDGYAARRTQQPSLLGQRLDVELDGLGIGVTILLALWYGQLPWPFLLLAVARFFFVWGIQWRERRNLPVHELPPSRYRRYWAGFQMGFLTVALWPIAPANGVTLVGWVYLMPILAGFLRDWLVVSDQLNPANPLYTQLREKVHRWFFGWLPLLARLILPLLVALQLRSIMGDWTAVWAGWGFTGEIVLWLNGFWGMVTAVGIFLILLGVGARWAALILNFPLAMLYVNQPSLSNSLILLLLNLIVLAGSGYGSLHQPRERFLFSPLGSDSP